MICLIVIYYCLKVLGIGDWGLGNPQSPIPNPQNNDFYNKTTKFNM